MLRGLASKNLPHHLAWMRLRTWRGQGVTPEEFIAAAIGRQVINVESEQWRYVSAISQTGEVPVGRTAW